MRKIIIILLTIIANNNFAQTNLSRQAIERKGLIFGIGLGAGTLALNTNDSSSVSFSTTIPNIKVGYMLHKRFALLTLLPGASYKYNGKDRSFEAIIVAGQYWIKESWWVMGGAGLTFDAATFYTVKDIKSAGFYTGLPAITFSTAFQVWHRKKFALDLQYRIFYGRSSLPNNARREGISNMFIIGFNWY